MGRELPIRWAELGTVYRYERSGTLHGLMRVRGFTQDDAHIFCLPEQVEDEIISVLDLTEAILSRFGFDRRDKTRHFLIMSMVMVFDSLIVAAYQLISAEDGRYHSSINRAPLNCHIIFCRNIDVSGAYSIIYIYKNIYEYIYKMFQMFQIRCFFFFITTARHLCPL